MVIRDRVAVLQSGRLEQLGTPDEICDQPATRFVAGFVGSPPTNVLTGELGDGQLRAPGFSVAAPPGSAAVERGSSSRAWSSRPSAWEPSGSPSSPPSPAPSVRTAVVAAQRVSEGTLVTLVAPADALVFFDQGGRYLARGHHCRHCRPARASQSDDSGRVSVVSSARAIPPSALPAASITAPGPEGSGSPCGAQAADQALGRLVVLRDLAGLKAAVETHGVSLALQEDQLLLTQQGGTPPDRSPLRPRPQPLDRFRARPCDVVHPVRMQDLTGSGERGPSATALRGAGDPQPVDTGRRPQSRPRAAAEPGRPAHQ